jgi:VanZ family protein
LNSSTRNFLVYWLPALIWTPAVLSFSSDPFSAEHTGAVLKVVFGWMQPTSFDVLHFVIRKLAHLSEYGLLALLWFHAFRGGRPGWSFAWARAAFGVSMAVAAIDEFHQSFVPSRTSAVRDVLIDCVGALVVLLIVRWFATSSPWRHRETAELGQTTARD